VTADGKFFRLGGRKFFVKGATYGPFRKNSAGESYPSVERAEQDLRLARDAGINVLRVYEPPARWFLDSALRYEIRVLVDIPWNKDCCFLDKPSYWQSAIEFVRNVARACASHPAVFAISVANEIRPDIARWCGARAVSDFIDQLVAEVKAASPACLTTFSNFPPTEYLRPRSVDFFCFNIYLHQSGPFQNYLARLQSLAEAKPLILGEFGMDTLRHGEAMQATTLGWQIQKAFEQGLAGVVVFSFTDEWHTGGRDVEDWHFGLTRVDRTPKPSLEVVRSLFAEAPHFVGDALPFVSVVVASYNGARTLRNCLESLGRLRYPAYEVILVDDGSTDETQAIAQEFTSVRNIRHSENKGLSQARNTGILAARGEIVAFTDSDCRADEDWLYYLTNDLLKGGYAGIGGHNFLPPDDSCVASAVMVSPGGPAHVMLSDRLAEHIPGCNMAFHKWALEEIGYFDPIFRTAGDDVDICWRLQQRGLQIGFSHAGFVWHYRRSTVLDYLKQQRGYGEAEALLVRKHPEYFNWFGGSTWQGRIYSPAKPGITMGGPMIYHGRFGAGMFQTLYAPQPALMLMVVTSLEFHVLITLPLFVIGNIALPFAWFGVASLAISVGLCVAAAIQAELPRSKLRPWSRPLIGLLYCLQPVVRGWARYRGRLRFNWVPLSAFETLNSTHLKYSGKEFSQISFWDERKLDREEFLATVLAQLEKRGWQHRVDGGWNDYDVEVIGTRWSRLHLTTAAEHHAGGKQMLRCRLEPAWTFLGRVVFCLLLGLNLSVLGWFGRSHPLLNLLWFVLPGFVWWLHREQRTLQRLVGLFLQQAAESLELIRVPDDVSSKPGS